MSQRGLGLEDLKFDEEVSIKTLKNRIKALEEENKHLKDQVQK
ncbi:hypothetical protein [Salipaludibacillus sp. LMS25]|jgi:hypothetical protein|nr:hypothetical protein [Salipaludibacillus sp. LMS25]